jgi:hypothetical protein
MCLICGDALEDGKPTPSDGVAFECHKHGNYAVAAMALPRFLALDIERREAAFERAKVFAPRRGNEIVVTALDL